MSHTKEFEAACNGEIDIIFAHEVGDDILAELDEWAEIGWLLLECGCLANANGIALHGSAEGHLEGQTEN
jgi:hypothetical protein